MTIQTARAFLDRYRYAVPFVIFFLASFALPTASHRIVFYLLSPVFLSFLYTHRDELKRLLYTKSFILLAAYLGYFLISSFWSNVIAMVPLLKAFRDVTGILVFSTSLALVIPKIPFSPKAPLYFALACLGFGVISAIVFFGFEAENISKRLIGLGRYKNSIHFSFLMSFAMIAVMCMRERKSRMETLMHLLVLMGLLFLATLSQSRTAYVALGMCMMLMIFMGNVRYVGLLAIVCAVCVVGVYFLWDNSFVGIFKRMDSFRLQIWSEVIAAIRDRPVFGHGLLTKPAFFRALNSGFKSPHNTILGHTFTGGIVGVIIYLLMVMNMLAVMFKAYILEKKKSGYVRFVILFGCVALCYTLTAGMFNFSHYVVNVHIHWLVFWTVFSVVWFVEYSEQPEQKLLGAFVRLFSARGARDGLNISKFNTIMAE